MPPVGHNGTAGPSEPLEVADPVFALVVRLEGPQGHAVVVGVRSFAPPSQRAVVTAIDPWTRVGTQFVGGSIHEADTGGHRVAELPELGDCGASGE